MKNVKNNVFRILTLHVICVNFHGHICNQKDEIRSYTKFQKAIEGISLSEVGEGTLPWAILIFRIFLNYLSDKFEKLK